MADFMADYERDLWLTLSDVSETLSECGDTIKEDKFIYNIVSLSYNDVSVVA